MASLPIPTPGQPVRHFMRSFGAAINPGLNTRSASGTTHRGPGGTTIYPSPSSAFPWHLFSFGYALSFDSSSAETTCTIYTGTVRIHGITNLVLAETEIVLTGTPAYVVIEYARPGGPLSLVVSNTDPVSTASTVRVPLHIFEGASVQPDPEAPAYLRYTHRRALVIGDIQIDTPIQ